METTEATEVVIEATMAIEDHSKIKMMRVLMNDGVDTLKTVCDSDCIHLFIKTFISEFIPINK